MPEQFLHGVEVVEIDTGPRPIRGLSLVPKSSWIFTARNGSSPDV